MTRARARRALPLLLGCLACAAFGGREPILVSDGRPAMGTVLEVTLVAHDEARARAVLDELFALAKDLDAMLSVYRPDSDLSRMNAAAGAEPVAVAPDVARLLELSVAYWRLTGGAFDVTVGPLIALWTEAAARDEPPTPEAIDAARTVVGAGAIAREGEGTAALPAGFSVNLGGVAKGYAVDRMRELLARRGIDRALVNFGQSSVGAFGAPPGGAAWGLLARGPADSVLGVLELRNRALSVSGSLGQWVEIGGERFGHVIDPRTGGALRRRQQSFVVAPEAALAEALSTALLVLGEDEGMALVGSIPGAEALLVDAEGGAWRTAGWDDAVGWGPAEP